MNYKEVKGDLIKLALNGEFDVIAHGCNCFCTMGAGIAPQMAKAFYCDTYDMEHQDYQGDINKLGSIDWKEFRSGLFVINAYTQYGFGRNHKNGSEIPLDYEALTLCMRKINHTFKGMRIGLPLLGCGLAGGIWDYKKEFHKYSPIYNTYHNGKYKDVKTIIQDELKDMDVTIIHFEPKNTK